MHAIRSMFMSDEDAIRRTIAQYCHFCDDGRFDEWADLYTDDATFRSWATPTRGGPTSRRSSSRASRPTRRGKHICFNTVIDIDGDARRAPGPTTSSSTRAAPSPARVATTTVRPPPRPLALRRAPDRVPGRLRLTRVCGHLPSGAAVAPARIAAAAEPRVEGVVVDQPAVAGEGVDELDRARLLVRRDVGPAVLDDLVRGGASARPSARRRPSRSGSTSGRGRR